MKANKLFYALGLLALAACSADTDQSAPEERVPVNLGYTMLTASETRTAAVTNINDATIAAGSGTVRVRICNTGGTFPSDTYYDYSTVDGGTMTAPTPPPYYPTDNTNIAILAYSPAAAATTFEVSADQTTDANYKASDLMVSTNITNQTKTTDVVVLTFVHKMAKIVVTATKGDGVNGIKTITLKQVKRQVTFAQTTGAVGDAMEVSGTDVTLFKDGADNNASGTGAAVIPAQTITGALLEIVTDQGTATYSVPDGKAFAAGNKYTMNVAVNRTAVGITNSVTWTSNESTLHVQPTAVGGTLPDRTPPGVTLVDLGLPSGTKWASRNIGAISDTDYGLYFAWGDVLGRSGANDGYSFSWTNTPYNYGSDTYAPTKYNYTDGLYQLEPCDDAAYMNWGGNWRMPTQTDWEELKNKCTWQSSPAGCKVTNKSDSNVYIFLPAAGYRINASIYDKGSRGYYWSSTLNSGLYFDLEFTRAYIYPSNRCDGYTVRPVQSN